MEEMELICFQIISSVGEAKSCYVKAMEAARNRNFELAEKLISQGDDLCLEGHKIHGKLIQKEASGERVDMNLLLVHSEDQLVGAEIVKIMVLEILQVYQQLDDK
ncbi:PTS system, cellobiose-specific IIA component [Granulicatella balaenopterae]|uniref:PTS system, cellobiose-specific IIA component n=1 Tax=Granulicatella balaenopterae TaxID=137733 RepID=A0A1H9N6D3_9LACT|nr:PTS lactose/cellobiose transporter subunit IIA [Granulicatella balaenopterae]SER31215.1 PTS system, cellobiose-specific IIA component [Granulicatella balaenopterae]